MTKKLTAEQALLERSMPRVPCHNCTYIPYSPLRVLKNRIKKWIVEELGGYWDSDTHGHYKIGVPPVGTRVTFTSFMEEHGDE